MSSLVSKLLSSDSRSAIVGSVVEDGLFGLGNGILGSAGGAGTDLIIWAATWRESLFGRGGSFLAFSICSSNSSSRDVWPLGLQHVKKEKRKLKMRVKVCTRAKPRSKPKASDVEMTNRP